MDYLKSVKEFHDVFFLPVDLPIKENEAQTLRRLRIALIYEELKELAEASGESSYLYKAMQKDCKNIPADLPVNRVEELDALCDLQYVLSGSVMSLGFMNVFNEAFKRVHDSNMSKSLDSIEEAEAELDDLALEGKTNVDYKITASGRVILVRTDGKIVKPSTYQPVNLKDLV